MHFRRFDRAALLKCRNIGHTLGVKVDGRYGVELAKRFFNGGRKYLPNSLFILELDFRLRRMYIHIYVGRVDFEIDEIGYLPIDIDAANLFFQLISKRYEKHCTIITTNTNFSKWSDIFGNSVIANAILDRLLHHSHIISVKGPSYRTKSKLEHLESSLTKM